ncbi:MAG: sulfatase-like hydrolase/transferase, partial [Terriglobia bacterium]
MAGTIEQRSGIRRVELHLARRRRDKIQGITMELNPPNSASQTSSTRRDFLKRSAAALPALAAADPAISQARIKPGGQKKRPNLLIVIADQFRWDCVGAYGLNPMRATPNLDGMARRGVAFQNAVTNQPLCSPSRACLFTGRYATQTGVWKLGPGLRPDAVTLATILRSEGYTANYIGKWHLAPNSSHDPASHGYVPPEYRGGFNGLWQASNELELTSHPYEGTIWDGGGTPMRFKDIYRVDYITGLAVDFLRSPRDKPFLLVVSQLEPHFQNDANAFIPPKRYANRFVNPFAPHDLRFFPGDWQAQLPGYYGDIKSIDDCVGTILETLKTQGILNETIVMFISDHGCHFRTRNAEYKRSPHESSIHIPWVIQGPGFDRARMIPELVSMVDVSPTLLDAMDVKLPDSMAGRSAFPLIEQGEARETWRNEVFIQISESMVGRALRTADWTYCVADRSGNGGKDSSSTHYE